jgi:hypothetical protein
VVWRLLDVCCTYGVQFWMFVVHMVQDCGSPASRCTLSWHWCCFAVLERCLTDWYRRSFLVYSYCCDTSPAYATVAHIRPNLIPQYEISYRNHICIANISSYISLTMA